MMWFYLFIFMASGCSLLKKQSFFEQIKSRKYYTQREIPVSSREEAQKIIQARHNYLKLLFEQTYDPHHGVPRWTPECLKANNLGSILETDDEIKFISELYLDPKNVEGHCPGRRYTWKATVIFLYCPSENKVYDLRFRFDPELNLSERDLCK